MIDAFLKLLGSIFLCLLLIGLFGYMYGSVKLTFDNEQEIATSCTCTIEQCKELINTQK